jgi:glycosyltransferase involved in cell wall biosynthesis
LKRILIIIARFEFGGIPNQALKWAIYLKKNNYRPVILAESVNDASYLSILKNNQIEFGLLDLKKSNNKTNFLRVYFYYKNLISQINEYDPYVILPFNKWVGYNINFIWRFTKAKKSFFLERGSGIEYKTSFKGRIARYLSLLNSSGIIYNSKSASKFSKFPRKTHIVKNSVEKATKSFRISDDLHKEISNSKFIILHVANLAKEKNYALILNSWNQLKLKIPNALLLVIGSDIMKKYSSIIQGFERDDIIYLDGVNNISGYMEIADLCILSSFNEGCPNVILEYILDKKIIVASDIPAIKEILVEENHKLLFNNYSEDDFVDKILEAKNLSENIKRKIISENLKKVTQEYSESNYNKLIKLIEN